VPSVSIWCLNALVCLGLFVADHFGRSAFGSRIVMGGYLPWKPESNSSCSRGARTSGLTVHFRRRVKNNRIWIWRCGRRSGRWQRSIVRPWLSARIGLNAVAEAVAQMSGPLAPVRSLVDPRKL